MRTRNSYDSILDAGPGPWWAVVCGGQNLIHFAFNGIKIVVVAQGSSKFGGGAPPAWIRPLMLSVCCCFCGCCVGRGSG